MGGLYAEGRVVIVQPGDPPYMWRKVREALYTVDRYRYRTHSAYSTESRHIPKQGAGLAGMGRKNCGTLTTVQDYRMTLTVSIIIF